MKNFNDFIKTLDDDKLLAIKKDIESTPPFIGAPTDIDRNFLQSFLISSAMLRMYHDWLNGESK